MTSTPAAWNCRYLYNLNSGYDKGVGDSGGFVAQNTYITLSPFPDPVFTLGSHLPALEKPDTDTEILYREQE